MMESRLFDIEEIFEVEFGPQEVEAYVPFVDKFNHSY